MTTQLDALVYISQTVIRHNCQRPAPTLMVIARTVVRVAPLLDADAALQSFAVLELCRRYGYDDVRSVSPAQLSFDRREL